MDKERRKALLAAYKTRTVIGGIYRLVNTENGLYYLQSTDDMQATRNWFESCRIFGDCTLPPIQEDWRKYGMDAFQLEELDLLEKKETQSRQEFQKDLKALLELWSDQLPSEGRY